MKIGILTFHSQLNYGGVLQCWALKTALEGMGHEVVVVDRWLSSTNHLLWRELTGLGVESSLSLLAHVLAGCGHGGKIVRILRTNRFLRKLNLTGYHFVEWREAPKDLGVDLLVVGSDQVWNPKWEHARAYLLEDVVDVPRISYAASFGVPALPVEAAERYRAAFKRFSAISCREKSGVEICHELGMSASHVVDPTLLLDSAVWQRFAGQSIKRISRPKDRTLVCYFLSEHVFPLLPLFEDFARRMNCRVEILTNDGCYYPFPTSLSGVKRNWLPIRRVEIANAAGPEEFVCAFSRATWTLTDSFHAVMFSSIFNCNARFLRPANAMRKVMFSRIEEFAEKCIEGPFLVNDVAQALTSFERGEKIAYDDKQIAMMREVSLEWLKEAINA